MALIETEVTDLLDAFLTSRGLQTERQYDLFDHPTDSDERSFRVDLVVRPIAVKGIRSIDEEAADKALFEKAAPEIDEVLRDLESACLFPTTHDRNYGWNSRPNPNPMVGLAVEIENRTDKYFLGSLMAASIAGRWGVLVAEDLPIIDMWINTIRRMRFKGSSSPIPSNTIIFKWPSLMNRLQRR